MVAFKMRFGIISVTLAALITLGIACGSEATPPPTPPTPPTPPAPSTPSGNQLPIISSLKPVQTQAYPTDMVEIRCEASDADGDTMSYEWTTTGGSISGTWQGTPGPVEFVHSGKMVSGTVSLGNNAVGKLVGTLNGKVLDFLWFVGQKDFTSGKLTFSADGKTAQGFFQEVPGGQKTEWYLKR